MSAALQFAVPSRPPPPRELARHRRYVFTEERFSWLRYEAESLFERHYREASADLSVPLDVNWEMYEQLERGGIEVCVVIRRTGLPIGYVVYILAPHLHYAHTVADVDVFYLAPEHRRGWLGIKLFQVAERLLREKGVSEVLSRVKLHVQPGRGGRDLGVMFEFLGYRPVETSYRKRIA